MAAKTEAAWYVMRTRAGASRRANDRLITRGPNVGELAQPERRDENEVERELRDAGFECYFPKMRKEIRHHRSKKRIEKVLPLFTGYVFVDMASNRMDFEALHDMRFVGRSLGYGGEARAIPASIVGSFRAAQENLEFDDTRAARIRRQEQGRTRKETLKIQFPIASRIKVKRPTVGDHPFAGFHGEVVSVTGKSKVRAMIELFGSLVPCDLDPQDIEAVDGIGEAA